MANSALPTSDPSLTQAGDPGHDETLARNGRGSWWMTRQGWITIVALVALVGVGIGIYDAVKYRFIPKRFGTVIPGEIYRSGQISRWMFEPTVKKYGIETVIDLNGVAKNDLDQKAEIASYATMDLNHYRFKLNGNGTGDVDHYIEAVATLATAHGSGETVLVHCHAGTQRTGSVLSMYRLLVLGASPRSAYQALMAYGWDPDSDQILLQYMNGHMREVAEALVARGIIEKVPDPLPLVGP